MRSTMIVRRCRVISTALILWLYEFLFRKQSSVWSRLRASAADTRDKWLKKPKGKSNVATLEFWAPCSESPLTLEATSTAKSPLQRPRPRSQGGFFEPSIDFATNRLMDTDAEYKLLSRLAELLSQTEARGTVYLYTELQPCQSCDALIGQFMDRFPLVTVIIGFDIAFPR
jgi:hypothetical protein